MQYPPQIFPSYECHTLDNKAPQNCILWKAPTNIYFKVCSKVTQTKIHLGQKKTRTPQRDCYAPQLERYTKLKVSIKGRWHGRNGLG